MKARNIISLFVVTLPLAAGSVACGSSPQSTDEPTAQTAQEQLIANGAAIMAWPTGPVVWNGLAGTWPIAVWSPATIGTLAFGISGFGGLGVTAVGFPGMFAAPITSAVLNGFIPPVAAAPFGGVTPFLGPSGLFAPAFGFTGAFAPFVGAPGWGFGLNAFAGGTGFSTTFANGAFAPGLNWWTPTLTSSALMFSNLAAINSFTTFTFNLTFHATAAQVAAFGTTLMPSLSIFATPIFPGAFAASTAAIPFTSVAFPILPMPILGAGLGVGAGFGAVAPVGVGAGFGAAVAPVGVGAGFGAVAPVGVGAGFGAAAPLL
jgi:hypothetical protein